MEKSSDAFRTISEVAEELELPQHVLRFWETRFPRIRPLKRAGGRRYYRPADVLLLRTIRQLLYEDGYTIKGVQRLLKEQGAKGLRDGDASPASGLEEIDPADTPVEESAAPTSSCPAAGAPRHALPPPTGPGTRAALLDMLAMIEDCARILDDLRREE